MTALTDKYLISVIVPVYNCERALHLTVDSLLNQTYKNIEILLVDDGAKDGSAILCDRYAEADSRVRVIHQRNKGAAGARNIGIKAAFGEYISFIDAGDYVELNLYESLIPYVEANVDLIDFPFYTQNSPNQRFLSVNKIEKNKVFDRDFIEREMIPYMLNIKTNPMIDTPPICFVWKYLFKKSIIDRNNILFDERRKKWEDKEFILKYADCIKTMVFFDKPLYTYICFGNEEHLSAIYFRNLVFLIIEQREEHQKEYGERYQFEADYFKKNSISTVFSRIEDIIRHENEADAKELITAIYAEHFVRKLAEWKFSNEEKMLHYQKLIKSNDINGTYLLMQQQIKEKKKALAQKNKKRLLSRIKRKAKSVIRPLYYRIKPGKNA